MKKILSTPYFSQHLDVSAEEWRDRACGVTCVAMAIAGQGGDTATIDSLIEEGIEVGAYDPSIGWIHEGLVRLLRNHGVLAYREEFRSRDDAHAVRYAALGYSKLVRSIDAGMPVIVSVLRNFNPAGSCHLSLVIGYDMTDGGELEALYVHEPDAKETASGEALRIPLDTFKAAWRNMAIFCDK